MSHLRVGTLLHGGTYRIVRFISRGGFGCTYEAVHQSLNKRVAIKEFFAQDFCERDAETNRVTIVSQSKRMLVERLRRKFTEEARAIAGFKHDHIVSVSDIFDENGTSYYVMDYIDGGSLADYLRDHGKMREDMALGVFGQVCDALEYVHDRKRLHLDIKPGNILLDGDGRAYLIDFGVSKQYDEVEGENTSTLLGKTPGYAPVEQMANNVGRFEPSTDIYALGATLYKMLSGVTPRESTAIASGERLDPLPGSVSEHVREVVGRAMSVAKHERPQSVGDLRRMLFEPEDVRVVSYRRKGGRWKKRIYWLGIPAILLIALAIILLVMPNGHVVTEPAAPTESDSIAEPEPRVVDAEDIVQEEPEPEVQPEHGAASPLPDPVVNEPREEPNPEPRKPESPRSEDTEATTQNPLTPAPHLMKVRGRVVDDAGEPLIGTVITDATTHRAVVNDIDGYYEIEVMSNTRLMFSYVNFETTVVNVNGRSEINVQMHELPEMLTTGH